MGIKKMEMQRVFKFDAFCDCKPWVEKSDIRGIFGQVKDGRSFILHHMNFFIGADARFYTEISMGRWEVVDGTVFGPAPNAPLIGLETKMIELDPKEIWKRAYGIDWTFSVLEWCHYENAAGEIAGYRIMADVEGELSIEVEARSTVNPVWKEWITPNLEPGTIEARLFGGVSLEWYQEHPLKPWVPRTV